MTLFWILAAAMVVVALLFIVLPLIKHRQIASQSRRELNVAIFRERMTDLDEDLAEASISEDQYRQARAELERDLLEDTTEQSVAPGKASGRWAAVVLAVAVPLLAVGLYWQIGAHHLVEGVAEQAQERGPSVEEMVARLVERMKGNPDDPEGWVMLGRSYLVMEQFTQAADAYAKAHALLGDEPNVLADYAEALSMAADANMAGRPFELIKEALTIDPNHTKALWLAGVAAYQGGEKSSAAAIWRKLSGLLPPESENARIVNSSIARVESEISQDSAKDAGTGASNAQVRVEVRLAETLRDQATPEDTVFVFARALSGPRAPLAAVRLQVKDLPTTITLDDSMAMVADRPLSSQSEVSVSARVSKSGNVIAGSGDLQGSLNAVSVVSGKPVTLTIDRVIP